jgi:hypothetical protein
MKQIIISLLVFLITNQSFSQDSLVPKQYVKIKEVSGDLDKDGIEEKVAVYNLSDTETENDGIDREVIIFKKIKGAWNIWHRSLNAVGNSKGGGMMGDPFENIEIKNGILCISQSGGSSWKWGHTDKYRYQNKNFELIGHNSHYGKNCEYWVHVDYNLSTGKIDYKKEYENCEDENTTEVYKTEKEIFLFKPPLKITFKNRDLQLKIITPKYKEEFYL